MADGVDRGSDNCFTIVNHYLYLYVIQLKLFDGFQMANVKNNILNNFVNLR